MLLNGACADRTFRIQDTQTGADEFAIAFAVDNPNGNARCMAVSKLNDLVRNRQGDASSCDDRQR